MQYVWEFNLDGKERKIELQHSRITGKRIIYFDGKEIIKAHKFTYEFSYSFSLDNHYLSITQLGPANYDLRIDNLAFNSILNEIKKTSKKNKNEIKEIENALIENNVVNVKNDNPKKNNKDDDADFFKFQNKEKDANKFDDNDFNFDEKPKKSNQPTISFDDIFG